MQKLLCINPSSSGHLILSINAPLSLNSTVLSLGFCGGAAKITQKMPTSSAAAFRHPHPLRHQPRYPFSVATPHNLRLSKTQTPPYSHRPCGCSVENGGRTAPFRAWVVPKGSNYGSMGGSHRAWYGTHAGNLDKGGGELVVENEVADDAENVKAKVQRQRSGGGAAAVGSPDLLAIPGVGPRNLRKLVEKGFEGVAQLKQLYKDKFVGKSSEKMVEYLQISVGIIHKNHAESITTFIKDSVDEEIKDDDSGRARKKRITLCVEGNISVGKSTFLQRIANETLELRDLVEVVPEPIDKWQNIGPDHFNILDAFYAEPERYAYTFQNYVFVTRVMQERESSGGVKPLRLMERSVFSDRMVFVRAVHEAKWMNEMEISIYDSWFDPVVSSLPGLIPDGFIYLRASPDTCHKRMMMRKRTEEGGVSLDYLRDLHEKHESWLFPFQSGQHGVLSVSKLSKDVDWSLHPNIRDRVFYLNGDHMHSSIQKVPALVLDCEPDIDFNRDIDAKREYACQVAEFFEFVKKNQEVSVSDVGEKSKEGHQVLLPHHGNLWMPGTQPFPDSALKSLDFSRALSSFMPQ
ncbi:deoxycytidine kinase [Phtheirospermum japonicum]|uniref:Deoxycytidine kinase n=1 Tax=Phtheirospermum japonicum TaxID=374723 RepID=A0A830B811_9LAMI|nr:deoxycytidine kinase [Phtheirospermum japonicum]